MASFTTTQSESETKEATLQNDIDLAIQDVMYLPKTGPTSLTSRLSIAGVKSDDILTSTLEDINIRFALAPKLTPILYSNIRKALLRNRIECIFSTNPDKRCVVITAPHTLKLLRDGEPPHFSEIHTRTLALRFAESIGGACITWTKLEIDRVLQICRSSEESLPPLSNRDPNYLTNHELVTSPWLEYLTLSRRSLLMATKLHSQQRSLHCDIHGMKDSTVKDVDVIFGLKAMELEHVKHNINADRVGNFRIRLLKKMSSVMNVITDKYNTETSTKHSSNQQPFVACVNHDRLNGYAGGERNTLTQMSSNVEMHGGVTFSISVQVEISLRLRKVLFENKKFCGMFVRALAEAASVY